jgi:hypothetical protein
VLKTWTIGSVAYLVFTFGFFAIVGNAGPIQFFTLFALFLYYLRSIDVDPIEGFNKSLINILYSIALAVGSWLVFWLIMVIFLLVGCGLAKTCEL